MCWSRFNRTLVCQGWEDVFSTEEKGDEKAYMALFSATSRAVHMELVPNLTGRGTQRQFSENICSEDDLTSRIFGTFVVKFLACLPLLGFSNI